MLSCLCNGIDREVELYNFKVQIDYDSERIKNKSQPQLQDLGLNLTTCFIYFIVALTGEINRISSVSHFRHKLKGFARRNFDEFWTRECHILL